MHFFNSELVTETICQMLLQIVHQQDVWKYGCIFSV